MRALRLTTRFSDKGYQGEACLLVYDEQRLNGAMLSEDVRDQFEERPATARIYILAPFVNESELRQCFSEGALFSRIGGYFHVRGGQLCLLTLHAENGKYEALSIPFHANSDGAAVEEPPVQIDEDLRNGWLFDLFDRHRGRLDAPAGVHFGKASGRHSVRFLRASNVLLSSTACAVVAYFALAVIKAGQPRKILVDTAPLIAVAFALQRIAQKQCLWQLDAPVSSFSSYGGAHHLPESSGKDLVLISASTSGGLVDRLKERAYDDEQVATLFFLETTTTSATAGGVVCDLTFKPGKWYGYPKIESYPAHQCPWCKNGLYLAGLEGDQFQLEKRAVKKLAVRQATQSADAREVLESLARKGLVGVRLYSPRLGKSEFSIDCDRMLISVQKVREAFVRALRRHLPLPLNYIVLVGLQEATFNQLVKDAELESSTGSAQLVRPENLRECSPVERGGALVVFGQLDDYAKARGINAQLRVIVPQGCVSYVAACAIADSAERLNDLRIFLTYGEHGRDTFTYAASCSLMLPFIGDEISPWELELELLQREVSSGKAPPEFASRLNVLTSANVLTDGLFWFGKTGELGIKNDFVYLNTGDNPADISQADIQATVSNLLASVRMDNRGLTSPIQSGSEPIKWHQSVYGHALLDPSNFENYNDPVLRAAFLRSARASELKYDVDEEASARVFSVVSASVQGWQTGAGDCLAEFLVSMATKRLTLSALDTQRLKTLLGEVSLPEYLQAIASQI